MKISLSITRIAAVSLLALALSPLTSMAAAAKETKSVAAGSKWEVDQITTLSELTIAEGATVTAGQGQSLTLTVNGVETPIKAGTYKGIVVLTPTKDLAIHFSEQGMTTDFKYRQGIYIRDGAYVPEQSVAAAVASGKVTNTAAEKVKITSTAERFNGIVVSGNSNYEIDRPEIRLTGNGKNDFAGVGAAVRAGGTSKVTINHATINNTGAVRSAIWVGDHSELTVNDSEIEVHNGVLPKNYGWSFVHGPDGTGTAMMEVPWMLGIVGNNRATLVTSSGVARYNNTHIKDQAWGALSTDAIQDGKIYLTKCHVEVVDSGYGAFADGQSLVHSSGSTFDVADYALILSGGTGVFTDGSVVNSRRIGVMAHGGHSGNLTIDKGSVFNTDKAVLQFKSSTPTILVDGATLNSKSGVILQMMANDDPNKMSGGGGAPAGGGGAPGTEGGAPGGGGAPSGGGAPGGGAPNDAAPGGAPPGGGMSGGAGGSSDLEGTFKNVTLKGDFYNSFTAQSSMNLSFANATITGAICTATAEHAVGHNGEKLVMQDASDLYYLIGEEKETCAATEDAHGASVSLDERSNWVVNKTSYLTGLTIAPGAKVSAPKGGILTMTVDGVVTPVGAGSYKGKIVLKVSMMS